MKNATLIKSAHDARRRVIPFALLTGLCALSPLTARADLLLTLDAPAQSALPGSLPSFTGTLTNTGPDIVFLNGIGFNYFGAADGILTGDDTPFFDPGFPSSLDAGGVFSGAIFGVGISSAAPPGDFFGSVTIQGGPTANDTTDLATQNFQITVTSAAPEPGTLALVVPLLGAVALVRRRSRRL